MVKKWSNTQRLSIYTMSLMYCMAGCYHFINPSFYLGLIPPFYPFPLELVYSSGVIELLLGGMLLVKRTRKMAALFIILMLLTFFHLHYYMMMSRYTEFDFSFFIAVGRFLVHFFLIFWAWKVFKERID